MTSITTTVTKRSLRTTVPADTYAEIERIAKACNISIAHATLFVIGCGLALLTREAERTGSDVADPKIPTV